MLSDKEFLYTLPLIRKDQYYHKEVNGKYTIAYKLHITLSAENYKRDRKIVASFLHKHGHYFKRILYIELPSVKAKRTEKEQTRKQKGVRPENRIHTRNSGLVPQNLTAEIPE